jgi:hypothetical protein
MSTIIAKHLLEYMNFVGAHTQFSHFECQETLHTLRNILITRLQQGKESFVLFVDLVKAFNTADHKSFSLYLEDMVFLIASLKSYIKFMQTST